MLQQGGTFHTFRTCPAASYVPTHTGDSGHEYRHLNLEIPNLHNFKIDPWINYLECMDETKMLMLTKLVWLTFSLKFLFLTWMGIKFELRKTPQDSY